MRYILDSNGYVKQVSFGADIVCGDDTCTEYTGSVPTGYASLEAWFNSEIEKLYRWKIVDGKLTLDSTAVAPGEVCGPSFLKITKNSDTTDYSASYNYFDPLRSATDSYGMGNFYSGTYALETYGDRSNYEVPGIYVGPGVQSVRVSASVRYLNNESATSAISTMLLKVRDGSITYIGHQSDTAVASGRLSHSLSTITGAKEGDFFCLMSHKATASKDIDVLTNYAATQLCVEAIR